MEEPVSTLYDDIGRSYATTRRPDHRIAAQLQSALGDARSVLNVGAGTGNYEPADGTVAVEPSWTMLRQRTPDSAPALRGVAEQLPVRTAAFDAALAVLTLHHWDDLDAGLSELGRVASRQVILYFEPLHTIDYWATEYFPSASIEREVMAPGAEQIAAVLDLQEVRTVVVPHDCVDGFGAAYWARPECYLDPEVQQGMSWLARLPPSDLAVATARLRADLESGAWDRRHGHLRRSSGFDGGYRIAVCGVGG